jgi:hypothetical protein
MGIVDVEVQRQVAGGDSLNQRRRYVALAIPELKLDRADQAASVGAQLIPGRPRRRQAGQKVRHLRGDRPG